MPETPAPHDPDGFARVTTVDGLPQLPALVPGVVRHRRREALENAFTHRAYLWLVDVDELPAHGALARFDSADHLGDPSASLRDNVLHFLHAQGEGGDVGRIVMLAAARVAGHVFDPLSVFWCFRPDGTLLCVVAEVHNTYGERDAYLLRLGEDGSTSTDKKFYVSPFFDVSGRYEMTFTLTRDTVAVTIDLVRDGDLAFAASFVGDPEPASRGAVIRRSVLSPLMPQRVTALIRLHGIALWARRLPLVTRPEHRPSAGVERSTSPSPRKGDTPDGDTSESEPRPRWDLVEAAPYLPIRALTARAAVQYACRVADVRCVLTDSIAPSSTGRSATNTPRTPEKPGILITPAALDRLARHPKLGLAEGYIAREWAPAPGTDLAELLERFAARYTALLPGWAWRLRTLTDQRLPESTRNDRRGAKRNIEAHYDLSNDLFTEFLDPTMNYSSALFDQPESGLEEAQERKMDAVLDLAGVRAGSRVLEIGTGWGSLAVRAARRGADVVTVTLSEEQHDLALQRAADAGVSDRVDVRIQDYRDVEGEYDALVSVEMIEAVGEEFWPDYVRTLEARLRPGGRAAVQAITMPHDRYLATRRSHGWVQEYIFPGGLIPSVAALDEVTRAHTALAMTSERSFGPDYARTLAAWRETFMRRWPRIAELGFSENFHRMWELYLAYCEAGFATGYLDVEHLVFTRPYPESPVDERHDHE